MDSAALATRLFNSIPNPNSSYSFLSTRRRPWRRPLSLVVCCLQNPNPDPASLPNPVSLPAFPAVFAQEAPRGSTAPAADIPRLLLRRLDDEFGSLP